MNAETKVKAEAPDPKMQLWNAVSKTDPRHTKKVNQRGGFTAISAHYQVMSATAAFGPVGIGWGYYNGEPIFHESLVIVPVTLWHGDRNNSFGPLYGSAEWKDRNGRLDADAPKKAATDGLTKALSHLGFNADVFLGMFDDNKYVQAVAKEFIDAEARTADEPAPRTKLEGPCTSATGLKTALKQFVRSLEGCGQLEDLNDLLADEETAAILAQCERDLPSWWATGEGLPAEFIPLSKRIAQRRWDLEQLAQLDGPNVRTVLNAG